MSRLTLSSRAGSSVFILSNGKVPTHHAQSVLLLLLLIILLLLLLLFGRLLLLRLHLQRHLSLMGGRLASALALYKPAQ